VRLLRALADCSVFFVRDHDDALKALRLLDIDFVLRDGAGSLQGLETFMGTLREIAPGTLVIAVGPPERRRPSTGRRWRWPAAPRPLATYAPGRFDVILTNVGMPGMTGWELVERIRGTDGAVPVFLITGWGLLDGEKDRTVTLHIQRVLYKPVQPAELEAALQAALAPV
jgi:CheY-like chemotaxis protein